MKRYILAVLFSMLLVSTVCFGQARADDDTKYQLLATTKTSTLQKEVDETQRNGFVIVGMVSRGEHMIIMERESDSAQ